MRGRVAGWGWGYKWGIQFASRIYRKERARGGMVMGIKGNIVKKGKKIDTETEGIITKIVKVKKEI